MSYQECDQCKEPFLTEADPYGIIPTNMGAFLYCWKCFIEKYQDDLKEGK